MRLVGAVLAEQTDEWAEGRRYLSEGSMALIDVTEPEKTPEITKEVATAELIAS